ncbi:unnamed protein product, partial [Ixodes persulcatus]
FSTGGQHRDVSIKAGSRASSGPAATATAMGSPSVLWAFLATALLAVLCQTTSAIYRRPLTPSGRAPIAPDLCPALPETCPQCYDSAEELTSEDVCKFDAVTVVLNVYGFIKPVEYENKLCGYLKVLTTLRAVNGPLSEVYRVSLDEDCSCVSGKKSKAFALLFKTEKVIVPTNGVFHLPLDHDVKIVEYNQTTSAKLQELLRTCQGYAPVLRLKRSDSYGGGYEPSYGGDSYSAPSYSAPSYSAPSYSAPS